MLSFVIKYTQEAGRSLQWALCVCSYVGLVDMNLFYADSFIGHNPPFHTSSSY
jgi:hypothetical protein